MIVSFIGWSRSLGFGYDIAFTILICQAKQQKQTKSLERSEQTTRTEEKDGNKGRYVRNSPVIHSVTNFFAYAMLINLDQVNAVLLTALAPLQSNLLVKAGATERREKFTDHQKKQELKKKHDKKIPS